MITSNYFKFVLLLVKNLRRTFYVSNKRVLFFNRKSTMYESYKALAF